MALCTFGRVDDDASISQRVPKASFSSYDSMATLRSMVAPGRLIQAASRAAVHLTAPIAARRVAAPVNAASFRTSAPNSLKLQPEANVEVRPVPRRWPGQRGSRFGSCRSCLFVLYGNVWPRMPQGLSHSVHGCAMPDPLLFPGRARDMRSFSAAARACRAVPVLPGFGSAFMPTSGFFAAAPNSIGVVAYLRWTRPPFLLLPLAAEDPLHARRIGGQPRAKPSTAVPAHSTLLQNPAQRSRGAINPDARRGAPSLQGKRIKYFQIYRWDPDQSSAPTVATYPIDLADCGAPDPPARPPRLARAPLSQAWTLAVLDCKPGCVCAARRG